MKRLLLLMLVMGGLGALIGSIFGKAFIGSIIGVAFLLVWLTVMVCFALAVAISIDRMLR